jgi:peptidoglycan endopeptidase LytE
MSTPNPLVPQGSIPPGKGRPNVSLIVGGIVAIHAVFFGGLLIQGCKPKEEPKAVKSDPAPLTPLAPAPTEPPATTTASTTAPGALVTPTPSTPAPPPLEPAPATVTPMPATPLPTADTAAAKEHVVTKGESFTTIGKKYNVSANAIAKANPGVDSAKLKVGQKLQVPSPSNGAAKTLSGSGAVAALEEGVYVVKTGDNLGKIAKSHGVTINALKEANSLKTDRINAGQKLKLPIGATKAASPAADAPTPAAAPAPTSPAGTAPSPKQ